MMNFIAVALASYFTQYHYKPPGDPILETVPIGEGAHIARLGRFIPGFPERIPLNLAFLAGARGLPARLPLPLAHALGLRDPGHRREPGGGGVRRHLDRPADRARDGDLGRPGRDGGDQRGARLPLPLLRQLLGRLRLHRHRGGPAGAQPSGGRDPRRAPVRGAAARRPVRGHLHRARVQGPGAGAPGDHHPVRGGGGAVPRAPSRRSDQGAYERHPDRSRCCSRPSAWRRRCCWRRWAASSPSARG